MECPQCGSQIPSDSKFCTNCGEKVTLWFANKLTSGATKSQSRKTFTWKTSLWVVGGIILTSLFWGAVYGTGDDQAVNIMSKLFKTVGRQKQAWTKSEELYLEVGYALSDDCIYEADCVNESIQRIMTLQAEIEKEKEEINRLWSESVVGSDFENYYLGLTARNQRTLEAVINIYFPEDTINSPGFTNQLL